MQTPSIRQLLSWAGCALMLVAGGRCPAEGSQAGFERRSAATGTLVGQVTTMGLPGPERARQRGGPIPGGSPVPVAGATIVVSPADGGSPQSALTDAHGGYVVPLPPGTYRVTMEAPARLGFSKKLPATVTIAAGQETRLDIHLDTGLRR